MQELEQGTAYANIVSTAAEKGKTLGFLPSWVNTDGTYIHKVTTSRAASEAGKKLRGDRNADKIAVDM